ncbi:unnamed protein product [Prorocentrum cordatum]|uniref:Uncharacterized protein n=1 Tax=Prorocentrum cordatum TaxID=2364126 RepID=A0ABN9WG35_9DINO|nr:unnamed protein product [Polarella glacialis]
MPHIPGRFLLLLSATLLMLHGASSWAARTISGRSQKAAEAAAGAEGGVGAGPAEEGNDWKRYGGYVAPSPAGGKGPEGRSSAWQPGAGDGPGGEAEGARRRCLKCEV